MSDVRDLTSQMAKELALGIKDSVEDIAAAFKKMAIINPDRHNAEKALPEAPIAGTPAAAEDRSTKAEQTKQRQILFEGLLERTIIEQKRKKSKKTVVDENQLSIFDFVA